MAGKENVTPAAPATTPAPAPAAPISRPRPRPGVLVIKSDPTKPTKK